MWISLALFVIALFTLACAVGLVLEATAAYYRRPKVNRMKRDEHEVMWLNGYPPYEE